MTNNQHGQVPEALIDLIDAYAETRHRCGGIYNARTEAARKAVIEDLREALGGVQALSAAPAAKKSALRTYPNPIVPLIKPVSEQEKMRALYLASSNLIAYLGRNGAIHSEGHAADAMMDCLNDLDGGGFDETLFAASPTHPAEQTFITPETGNSASAKGAAITSESGTPPAEQQAAPKAAPGEPAAIKMAGYGGCTGINDYLMSDGTIKTMRPHEVVWREAPQQAVAGEPVANDIHGALTAAAIYLTNAQRHGKDMHRQAIASLEKAQRAIAQAADFAKAAPQQAAPKTAPGEPSAHQILAITTAYEQGVGKGHQAHESGKEIANPYDSTYRCDLAWQYGYEEGKEQAQRATKAAPQSAPAPLSDDVVKDAAFEAVRKKLCALPRYSFVLDDDGLVRRAPDRTGNWIEFDEAHALFDPVSVDAAIAAQGGKV